MVYKRCRRCLGPLSENDDETNKQCPACGISTGELTSVCIHNKVIALGKNTVGANISENLARALQGAEVVELDTGIPGKPVAVASILETITLNLDDAVSEDIITEAGISAMKKVIKAQQNHFKREYGIDIDDVTMTTIVAHLYDVEAGKLAPVIVQKTPDRYFYLSEDVANEKNRDLVYVNPRVDSVKLVGGDGEAVFNPIDEMDSVVIVKKVHQLPLIFIYDADRDGRSRLFVFI